MMGMHKRVTVAFLSIVALLFFSGMVSFVELGHLSRDTDEILRANERNIALAKEMLDAAHDQNVALIRLAVFGDDGGDTLCRRSMDRLEETLHTAQQEAVERSFLDSLAFATTEMRLLTDSYLASRAIAATANTFRDSTDVVRIAAGLRPDSVGALWYNRQYERLYTRLVEAIKSYMTSTQSSLAPRTEQMKKNAYRAVTPVLISLAVMIAIVLMLFYFIRLYCVDPVVKMNRALGAWLSYRVPFSVKADFKDEVAELRDRIEALVGLAKQSKSGRE